MPPYIERAAKVILRGTVFSGLKANNITLNLYRTQKIYAREVCLQKGTGQGFFSGRLYALLQLAYIIHAVLKFIFTESPLYKQYKVAKLLG